MPELPEVETTTLGLKKTVVSLIIKDVWSDLSTKDKRKSDTVANTTYFKHFKKEILNKKILSVERRAKNILINLSGDKTILIHMKMTGHLLYGKYKFVENKWVPDYADKMHPFHDPFNRFVHVVFTFASSKKSKKDAETHLAFSDARKFGKITLLDTKNMHTGKHLENIGPEPLLKSFNAQKLKERLDTKPNGKIKTVLMDQNIIAGIGNIYSDEILWLSHIHPERKSAQIENAEIKMMHRAIKETLSEGIDFGGDSMSDYRNIGGLPGKFQLHHRAYRKTGEKCGKKNCKGIIERKMVNGRSAHFCSAHQK